MISRSSLTLMWLLIDCFCFNTNFSTNGNMKVASLNWLRKVHVLKYIREKKHRIHFCKCANLTLLLLIKMDYQRVGIWWYIHNELKSRKKNSINSSVTDSINTVTTIIALKYPSSIILIFTES